MKNSFTKMLKVPVPKYVDGLLQERRNSIANAPELCLSCINPLMYENCIFKVTGMSPGRQWVNPL